MLYVSDSFISSFNKCINYMGMGAITVAMLGLKMNKLWFLLSGLGVLTRRVAITMRKKTKKTKK